MNCGHTGDTYSSRDKGKMVARESHRPCSGAKGIQEDKARCLDPNAKARHKTGK